MALSGSLSQLFQATKSVLISNQFMAHVSKLYTIDEWWILQCISFVRVCMWSLFVSDHIQTRTKNCCAGNCIYAV